ncbi:site-specific DNA-methyltransferase [Pseudaminobacter sp. 19-2017]|uniref:Methyltransferase n=1 Tax=Pseudaminobacter soli (ex Zhang et al. 2022) TaxID=2831468 RepID=A0A942E768_9HYPH|nr:site-specific DNA-methyltransferase [Pseudaminobacter soli]
MSIQFAPEAIEQWPIERLKPYAKNAKTHAPDQVTKIAASMAEFGWTVPVLVSAEGEVIAGHGRILAAGALGLANVPVIVLEHLSEAQRRAYRIADNKLTELGGWDDSLLSDELQALSADRFDLSLTGLDEADLDRLMGELGMSTGAAAGEDEVPEPPADPVTRPGDLWVLGRHRLLCGDATVATDVERLLAGTVPHLMVTDPPFGVNYDPTWRNEAGVSTTSRTGKVANDDRADWRDAWALFPGDVAYVWHAGVHASTVADSLVAAGFGIRSQIIWAKPRLVLSRGHYHWQHEPCWYAVRDGATGHWQGARDQTTIWAIGAADQGEDDATVHGTQKPVECMRRPILNNSTTGAAVYEPFSGSGTTIIAAETTGRACFAMELDPRYCDVAVERWQRFTGRQAALERSAS